MHDSDEQLLERLRRGDDAAFEGLFTRHYSAVARVLYGLLGQQEEAEDLAQETFLTLLHHPPRLEAGTHLAAWLCRVALNRGLNVLRGRQRAWHRLRRLVMPGVAPAPDAAVLRAEERDHVRQVLATLPERQSKLLLLRYAGLSYAEIAAVLEIAPGSIGTLLARAERAFVAACRGTNILDREDILKVKTP